MKKTMQGNCLLQRRLKKPLQKLELTLLLFLCSFLCVQGNDSVSLTHQIQLSFKDITVEKALKEITKQTGYNFMYSEDFLNIQKKVNLNLPNTTLEKALDEILGSNYTYKVMDDYIMIQLAKKTIVKTENRVTDLPQAKKTYEIKGVVLEERTNVPLPGVNVVVAGSTIGVATDVDGNFVLNVPEGTQNVEFTFVGYNKKVIPFRPNQLNAFRVVMMQEQKEDLEEVTVVAFGKQKKESMISSITTVSPKDLKVPSSNLTTALAGRIAGVISYQRSGEPGADNAEFFIRGVTTFGTGKADPLILIDQIELSANDLSRLNPDDIESFSILKDATATSLYGARGANGVVMVTTKEGKEGKARISVRFENSISAATKDYEVSDPITFMELHNEAIRTRDPLTPLQYSNYDIDKRKEPHNPYAYPIVDWKKMLFKKNVMNQRLNLNLSGGGTVARYYVAGSYYRDNGIMNVEKRNNFNSNIQLDKYLLRSNININVTPTTELIVRLHGTFDDYQGPISGGTDLYNKAIKANPVLFPAFYAPDKANLFTEHPLFGNYGKNAQYMNPYAEMVKGYKEYSNTMVLAQLELNQDMDKITKGLKAHLMGNTTRTSYFDVVRQYKPYYYELGSYDKATDEYVLNPLNAEGDGKGEEWLDNGTGGKRVTSTIYMELSAIYNRTFAEKHAASGMLVYTIRESLNGEPGDVQASLPTRNMGLAGRFTYGYDNRYLAEFNFGYNGSERFDKNHRWGFFPSAGVAWYMSNEKFWDNGKIRDYISKLKLKATYGIVGNDQIGKQGERFFYLSNVTIGDAGKGYRFGTDFVNSKSGVSISRYADPKIGWEIAHKTNLGVELGLFRYFEIQADYFRERRTNILQSRASISSTMGLGNAVPSANIGEAKGEGVDMSLDYSQSFDNTLWVTARGNFTYASSKYKVYEEPDYSATAPWLSKVGRKISQGEGLVAERLFVDENEVANSPRQQFGEYMGGDIKYKDINDDGLIDSRDVVPIGFPTTPEIIYGMGVSVGYKGFDISCFFQGSARSSFYINAGAISPFINTLGEKIGNNAVSKFIEESHWSEENRNIYAEWPRLSNYAVNNNNQTNTWFMRNGNFLRLKSAEIGYSLPARILQRCRMEQLRVYVSGTNLLCFSNYKLWDPEMGGDGLGYPVQRVGNIGIQISF